MAQVDPAHTQKFIDTTVMCRGSQHSCIEMLGNIGAVNVENYTKIEM